MRMGWLAVALVSVLAVPARAQTLEEVQRAVDDYFADGAASAASHAALERWGGAALPFLRELAGQPDDLNPLERLMPVRANDWALVCAIRDVDTPQAIEILVEILDDKTSVSALQALNALSMSVRGHAEQLQAHVRFRQLIFKFAKADGGMFSGISRCHAADVIAVLGWEDGEPLLELMLQDKDLGVRKCGAQALESLTGRDVEVRKPPLAFPSERLEGVISHVGSIDNEDLRGRLDVWFDDAPALIMGSGKTLTAMGMDGMERERARLPVGVADILSLRMQDRSLRWVLLADEENTGSWPHANVALCVDREQRELWRFEPAGRGIKAMCRLYDAQGCVGVAVGPGGSEGVVAFDPEGHELFRVPRKYVTYELSSHPRLPDLWLHCGGELSLFDNHGRLAGGGQLSLLSSDGFVYASNAVLFPAADGTAAIVAVGSGFNSTPMLVYRDAEMRPVWQATVPDRLTALALLDPGDREPLLAATTEGGELLIFDRDGVLRQRQSLVEGSSRPTPAGNMSVYSISAGLLPDGRYGLAVGLLGSTLVFALS